MAVMVPFVAQGSLLDKYLMDDLQGEGVGNDTEH